MSKSAETVISVMQSQLQAFIADLMTQKAAADAKATDLARVQAVANDLQAQLDAANAELDALQARLNTATRTP